MREKPIEGWILAGTLAGRDARPRLEDDVAGLPYVQRLACDLAAAGVKTIVVVWNAGEPPELRALLDHPHLRLVAVTTATAAPDGDDGDAIVIVRADRIFHRDTAKQVVKAWTQADAPVARLDGAAHDAVVVTTRARARAAADAAAQDGGIEAALAGVEVATIAPPYLGFTAAAADRRAHRRAERELVWSLRKEADGLASRAVNRHLSLRVTWWVMRTPIRPNDVTIFCFALAVAGGVVLAQGGYLAGVIGLLLVNLGSIIDGVDGEIARLKYRFSRVGQWMDTLADDFGNVAYVTGLAINLDLAGGSWALPTAAIALGCFALTQATQYWLISGVYKSGDLAAIPWAFQSHEFLSARPTGVVAWLKANVPKMLKRDFCLTVFVGFALIGRLDLILVVFATGAIVFFGVFFIQCIRNLPSIREASRGSRT